MASAYEQLKNRGTTPEPTSTTTTKKKSAYEQLKSNTWPALDDGLASTQLKTAADKYGWALDSGLNKGQNTPKTASPSGENTPKTQPTPKTDTSPTPESQEPTDADLLESVNNAYPTTDPFEKAISDRLSSTQDTESSSEAYQRYISENPELSAAQETDNELIAEIERLQTEENRIANEVRSTFSGVEWDSYINSEIARRTRDVRELIVDKTLQKNASARTLAGISSQAQTLFQLEQQDKAQKTQNERQMISFLQGQRAFSHQVSSANRSFDLQKEQFEFNKKSTNAQQALAKSSQAMSDRYKELDLYGKYVVSNMPEDIAASVMSALMRDPETDIVDYWDWTVGVGKDGNYEIIPIISWGLWQTIKTWPNEYSSLATSMWELRVGGEAYWWMASVWSNQVLYLWWPSEGYGIDLLGTVGDNITAPMDGKITKTWEGSAGKFVELTTDDWYLIRFNHLNETRGENQSMVTKEIKAWDSIWTLGNTGNVLTSDDWGKTWRQISDTERAAGKNAHLDFTVQDSNGKYLALNKMADYVSGVKPSSETDSSIMSFDGVAQDIINKSSLKDLDASITWAQENYQQNPDYVSRSVKDTWLRDGISTTAQKAIEDDKILKLELIDIREALTDFEKKFWAGKLGLLTKNKEWLYRLKGGTSKEEIAYISTRMQNQLDAFGRDRSGAAISETEWKNFRKILPGIGKQSKLNHAIIAGMLDSIEAGTTVFKNTQFAEYVWKEEYLAYFSQHDKDIEKTLRRLEWDGEWYVPVSEDNELTEFDTYINLITSDISVDPSYLDELEGIILENSKIEYSTSNIYDPLSGSEQFDNPVPHNAWGNETSQVIESTPVVNDWGTISNPDSAFDVSRWENITASIEKTQTQISDMEWEITDLEDELDDYSGSLGSTYWKTLQNKIERKKRLLERMQQEEVNLQSRQSNFTL